MTVCLPTIPTFGFETKRCYAKGVYRTLAKKELGIRDEQTATDDRLVQLYNREIVWMLSMNVNKAAGYIPGISTIAGIWRLAGFAAAKAGDLPFIVDDEIAFVARATLDICCLGWTLIPFDVYATRIREQQATLNAPNTAAALRALDGYITDNPEANDPTIGESLPALAAAP